MVEKPTWLSVFFIRVNHWCFVVFCVVFCLALRAAQFFFSFLFLFFSAFFVLEHQHGKIATLSATKSLWCPNSSLCNVGWHTFQFTFHTATRKSFVGNHRIQVFTKSLQVVFTYESPLLFRAWDSHSPTKSFIQRMAPDR